MSSFRRVVSRRRTLVISASELGWAVVWWGAHLLWRRRSLHLDLIESRSTLIGRGFLGSIVVWLVLPLAMPLGSSAWRPVFSLTSSGVGSVLGRSRSWCTTSNAWCARIGMMLVRRPWILSRTRRGSWIAHKWTNLRRSLCLTGIRWQDAILSRWR